MIPPLAKPKATITTCSRGGSFDGGGGGGVLLDSTRSPQAIHSEPLSRTVTLRAFDGVEDNDDNDNDDDDDDDDEDETNSDRIRGVQDIFQALCLTWNRERQNIISSWLHIPLGIVFLLFFTWCFKQGIERTPVNFPAPVLAMAVFFFLLLLLDSLSVRFPKSSSADLEKQQQHDHDQEQEQQDEQEPEQQLQNEKPSSEQSRETEDRRFVEPVMKLLAPPCDFCLRYMSVMFTPSFILIPAREVIPGKEIGLITAWFTITQVIAFVIPVLLHWLIEFLVSRTTNSETSPPKKRRRASIISLEKAGQRVSMVITGIGEITALAMAPINLRTMTRYEDERRQITHVMIETARQQGDPAVASAQDRATFTAGSPHSGLAEFEFHRKPSHHARGRSRSRNVAKSKTKPEQESDQAQKRPRSISPNHGLRIALPSPVFPQRSNSAPPGRILFGIDHTLFNGFSPQSSPRLFQTIQEREDSQNDVTNSALVTSVNTVAPTPKHSIDIDRLSNEKSPMSIGKNSNSPFTFVDNNPPRKDKFDSQHHSPDENGQGQEQEQDQVERQEPPTENAISRLSNTFSRLLNPLVYLLLLIIGLPLFYVANIALPLFLAVNLLTFLVSITLVPPPVRRFLHPILSTSLLTVLILWALGAIKGYSLRTTLGNYYSTGAKYSVLWSISPRYSGPPPGAGDLLTSTLDAGIVALALPMYRYRRDLAQSFIRIVTILIPCCMLSLFLWPYVAAEMGISPSRSLSFAARFMSTPLAIELANTIEADESITVILVVVTGIVAAILKEPFFRLMRVDMDNHLCVGITMGSTAGAIGSSSLIMHPRVMAIASLSFVIFGTILLILTAIPPIVDVVQNIVSLK